MGTDAFACLVFLFEAAWYECVVWNLSTERTLNSVWLP